MTLEELPPLIGWCPPEKRDWLVRWIEEHKPTVVAELGVYGGASLLPMAYACREWSSKVVGIDPWDVKTCLEGMQVSENRRWWRSHSELGMVEESCRAAIAQLGLTNVELWKGRSDTFKDSFHDNEIELLSIDGNHGAQALVDGQNYLRKVKVGGLIACDDEWWREGGIKTVQVMIDWLLANGCRYVESIEGCAMLIKER